MAPDFQVSATETISAESSNQKEAVADATASTVATDSSQVVFPSSEKSPGRFPSAKDALLIAILVAAGSYSILPIWLLMSRIWLGDPLRAIGAVFPLISIAGVLVAWRRIGWSMNGTFWALPFLALSILFARVSTLIMLDFRFHEQNGTVLHTGPVMFLYGVGAVLLFGGTRLLRAAIAPLCLLLLINPVPYFYNAMVDLPLQYLSANTARHFAHLIGLQPTGEQLRMMFSPGFGMQIVPGCNGVRGSITLAYLALIFGYMRHLRVRVLAPTVLCAFLGGYALNLLRLCILVIYYRIGLSFPSIQPYGAGVDYGIGCTLFLFATLAVGLFIRWIEPAPEAQNAVAIVPAGDAAASGSQTARATLVRAACFVALTLAFIVPTLGKGNTFHVYQPNEQALLSSFPAQVGNFQLVRAYGEHDSAGVLQYVLADYFAPANGADPGKNLTFGIYVGSGMHLVAYSRFVQGYLPESTGSFDALDAVAQPALKVHFATSFYNDGLHREYNAESACYETGCSATIDASPTRLIFAPRMVDLVYAPSGNRLTILLRREWPESDSTPSAALRTHFDADARQFTEQLNLRTMLHQDGSPI